MDENLGSVMGQVSRLIRRSFDERARAIGITRPQWQVLSILSRNSGINQGCLAEILEVEPITAGRMIDRLQDAKLVERHPDPTDRRAWRLHLTSAGEQLVEQLHPLAIETLAVALDGINKAEQEQLRNTLDRIRTNLTRYSHAEATSNG